jgi:formylglycine-generating enzyme required for sulfatase activity
MNQTVNTETDSPTDGHEADQKSEKVCPPRARACGGGALRGIAGGKSKFACGGRGGSWAASFEVDLRPAFHFCSRGPDERRDIFGFRCVLIPQSSLEQGP